MTNDDNGMKEVVLLISDTRFILQRFIYNLHYERESRKKTVLDGGDWKLHITSIILRFLLASPTDTTWFSRQKSTKIGNLGQTARTRRP